MRLGEFRTLDKTPARKRRICGAKRRRDALVVGAKLCHSLPSGLNRFPAHALTDITKTEDQPNLGWHWLCVVLVVWTTTTDISTFAFLESTATTSSCAVACDLES